MYEFDDVGFQSKVNNLEIPEIMQPYLCLPQAGSYYQTVVYSVSTVLKQQA